jgi:hypothetical protein
MKNFMVIEHFQEGRLDEIYERFHTQGRMLPEGLHYIDSWLSTDGLRCFQLMRTDQESLFVEWEKSWADLAKFEVIELREKPAAAGDS